MKKMLIALSLSTALFGAAPLYAEEAAAPAPATVAVTTEAAPAPYPPVSLRIPETRLDPLLFRKLN